MLIAFTGCWHSNHTAIKRALEFCKEHEIKTLIQTGDFLYNYYEMKLANEYIEQLALTKGLHDLEIIGIRGNHDNPAMYRELPVDPDKAPLKRINTITWHAPDGTIIERGGKRIALLGGAFSVDRAMRREGKTYWADEITEVEAIERLKNEQFDVLVTHEPPAGIPYHNSRALPDFWDIPSAEAHRVGHGELVQVAKPQLVITGHMHRFQRVTLPFNDESGEWTSITLDHGHYGKYEKTLTENNSDFIWVLDTDDLKV